MRGFLFFIPETRSQVLLRSIAEQYFVLVLECFGRHETVCLQIDWYFVRVLEFGVGSGLILLTCLLLHGFLKGGSFAILALCIAILTYFKIGRRIQSRDSLRISFLRMKRSSGMRMRLRHRITIQIGIYLQSWLLGLDVLGKHRQLLVFSAVHTLEYIIIIVGSNKILQEQKEWGTV